MDYKIISIVLLMFILITDTIKCNLIDLNLCDDWIAYNKDKCFKVIAKRVDKTGAQTECRSLDPKASLITIGSAEEQLFVEQLLANYSTVTDKVWTGITGTNTKGYSNWVDGTSPYQLMSQLHTVNRAHLPRSMRTQMAPYEACVQISVTGNFMGKWYGEPCGRRGLIMCEKPQHWSVEALSVALNNLTRMINTQQNTIQALLHERHAARARSQKAPDYKHVENKGLNDTDDQNNYIFQGDPAAGQPVQTFNIPIGFVYIQLPNQSAPRDLWPLITWQDVTREYSGLFFRAEGGESGPFGQIQQSNYTVRKVFMTGVGINRAITGALPAIPRDQLNAVREGEWSGLKASDRLLIHTTRAENRPINTAIRVWKRVL